MNRLFLAALLFLTGCAATITPGSQGYVLPPDKLAEVTARANEGSPNDIWALVNHYGAYESDQNRKKARTWALRGTALGEPNCKQWLWEHFSE
jgi:hypothetical protein